MVAIVITILGSATPAFAVDPTVATWDGGAGDGLWSSAANWSGDVVPGPTTAVVIENQAATVHLDVNFTFSGVGSFKLAGFGANAPTLVVDAGRTLTFDNPGQNRNVVESDATLRNEGTVRVLSEFNAQLLGNVLNAAGATWNVGAVGDFATMQAGGPADGLDGGQPRHLQRVRRPVGLEHRGQPRHDEPAYGIDLDARPGQRGDAAQRRDRDVHVGGGDHDHRG